MNKILKALISALLFSSSLAVSSVTFALDEKSSRYDDRPKQIIEPGNLSDDGRGNIEIPLYYRTSDGSNAFSGLGLRIHYNSSDFSAINLGNAVTDGLIGVQDAVDDADFDSDPSTDRFIMVAWGALGSNIDIESGSPLLAIQASAYENGPASAIRFSAMDTQANHGFASKAVEFHNEKGAGGSTTASSQYTDSDSDDSSYASTASSYSGLGGDYASNAYESNSSSASSSAVSYAGSSLAGTSSPNADKDTRFPASASVAGVEQDASVSYTDAETQAMHDLKRQPTEGRCENIMGFQKFGTTRATLCGFVR